MNTLQRKGYAIDTNDDAALLLRSPIAHISEIDTPLFLLHRKGNPLISDKEVTDFYQSMLAAEKVCFLTIREKTPEDDPQKISYEEVRDETEAWVDEVMNESVIQLKHSGLSR